MIIGYDSVLYETRQEIAGNYLPGYKRWLIYQGCIQGVR
jgi:hypothetical protein